MSETEKSEPELDLRRRETEARKRLMTHMTRHQRKIFAYIYTLVPHRDDAEDILQETSLVICEKFDDFTEGSDFVAWACQIAWWCVRSARQKYARSKVIFDQATMEVLATTAHSLTVETDERHDALAYCLRQLHPRDRELVLTRYEPGNGVEQAAQRTGRSLPAAYKALQRLRKLLLDCVNHRLNLDGLAPGGAT